MSGTAATRTETGLADTRSEVTTRAATARKRTPLVTIIAAVPVYALVLAFLAMPLFGLKTYVITGGSMSGSIDRGALIFDKAAPVSSLKVGDVITYRPPEKSGLVTHRIISIERQTDGKAVFKTKGDANKAADPWQFTLDRPVQAKYIGQIPYLGYAFALVGLPVVRALLFAVPALLIVVALFLTLWRRAGEASWLRGPKADVPQSEDAGDPRQHRRVTARR